MKILCFLLHDQTTFMASVVLRKGVMYLKGSIRFPITEIVR